MKKETKTKAPRCRSCGEKLTKTEIEAGKKKGGCGSNCADCISENMPNVKDYCVCCGITMEKSIARYLHYGNYCQKCCLIIDKTLQYKTKKENILRIKKGLFKLRDDLKELGVDAEEEYEKMKNFKDSFEELLTNKK